MVYLGLMLSICCFGQAVRTSLTWLDEKVASTPKNRLRKVYHTIGPSDSLGDKSYHEDFVKVDRDPCLLIPVWVDSPDLVKPKSLISLVDDVAKVAASLTRSLNDRSPYTEPMLSGFGFEAGVVILKIGELVRV